MRDIRIRAAEENRKLKDLVTELLRCGLIHVDSPPSVPGKRVQLPIVHNTHAARPEDEMPPDRMKELLLQQEIDRELGRQ